MGGGGGAVRGMVAVGTPLAVLGLGDRGDEMFLFAKLVPDPDAVRPRLGGGGGGPLPRFGIADVEAELDIFRPPGGGGAGGFDDREGGGGGGPVREGADEGLPTLEEIPPLIGGGGGPFPLAGGPARVGGGGGALLPLLPPGVGRGNCGGPPRELACCTDGIGGLGPLVDGEDAGELNLLTAGRLTPLLKPGEIEELGPDDVPY